MLFFKLAIAVRNIMSMFAAFNAKGHFHSLNVAIAIFVVISYVSIKIRGCSNSCGLWHLCDNLFFGENGRRTAFSVFVLLFSFTNAKEQ